MFTTPQPTLSDRRALVLASACITLITDWLFFDGTPGLGFLVCMILVSLVALGYVIVTKNLRNRWALWFLVPTGIFALDAALYNNTAAQGWIPLFSIISLGLCLVFVSFRNPEKKKFFFSAVAPFNNLPLFFLVKPLDFFAYLFRGWSDRTSSSWRKGLTAVIISLPILGVFAFLFSQADLVFAHYLASLFRLDIEEETIGRIARALFVGGTVGLLFFVLGEATHRLGDHTREVKRIDTITALVILGLINLLFASFVFIQVRYLFGAHDILSATGVSYAEYARSGFFELVWVMALSAALLLVLYRSAAAHGGTVVLQLLKTLLIVQVGVIAYSALTRMNLYQDAFGYAVLRLYVEWFIYAVLVALLFTVFSIWKKIEFRMLIYSVFGFALCAGLVVASVNVDRVIAKENVDRFIREGKNLDVEYLFGLSLDALPEMDAAVLAVKENPSREQLLENASESVVESGGEDSRVTKKRLTGYEALVEKRDKVRLKVQELKKDWRRWTPAVVYIQE